VERGKNMKGMIFKKAFLIGGIFLLATFMLAQSSWGCDDDDKWDRDCHDRWDCDHQCWSCNPPKIQRVFLDYNPDSETFIRFWIWGKNFDKGAPPAVTLGGEFDLTVREHYNDYMVAALPMSEEEGFEFGDYRLVVSTCHDSKCKYCKDYCSKCKDKHCRDYCSKCKDRYCKNKYCKDDEYKCKCKDRYSLTIPGPSGQLGTIGSVIVATDGKQISTNEFEGYALCDQGYTVTGGGFKSINFKIVESRPDGNGWYVLGRLAFDKEIAPALTIYAVCAKIR
jgi:hypothetical protein